MSRTEPTAEEEYLISWAFKQNARYQPEGECGFGRECVGILASNGHYPDWDGYEGDDYHTPGWVTPDAAPPDGVEDAYHKHPCLAVLGRDPEAVHQLYLWVRHLDEHGVGIKMLPRRPTAAIDAMFHGMEQAILTRVEATP